MIADKTIDLVRDKADIVEVLGQYLGLKRAGRNFKAICPFHSEKTPSLIVSPEKQLFKCFGCGEGGNVFSFLMKYEGISFIDAVRSLADQFQIEIVEDKSSTKDDQERDDLLEIHHHFTQFFHQYLVSGKKSIQAKSYLEQRGLSLKILKKFKVGYSGVDSHFVIQQFKKKQIPISMLVKSGLILQSGRDYRLRFYDRVMFPIFDSQGRVVGFGGRSLKEGQMPKYLNSSDSPIFNKSNILYGLNHARRAILKERFVIVVEGYMDVLMLHQFGIENVVGVLGTSLTQQHIRLIRRLTSDAILCFDSDLAGENASLRSMELFLESDMIVRVLKLPLGEDPDSILIKKGSESFMNLVHSAPHMLEFKLNILMGRYDLSTESGKRKIIDDMLSSIKKISDSVSLQHHLDILAKNVFVPIEVLNKRMSQISDKIYPVIKVDNSQSSTKNDEKKYRSEKLIQSEKNILHLIAKNETIKDLVKSFIQSDDFKNDLFQKLLKYYYQEISLKHDPELDRARSEFEIGDFVFDDVARQSLADSIKNIKEISLEEKRNKIQLQILEAEKDENFSQLDSLFKEKMRVINQIKELDGIKEICYTVQLN